MEAPPSITSYSGRQRELQAFDDTKAGVKGLVDAGVQKIPYIFVHPPDAFAKNSDIKYKLYTFARSSGHFCICLFSFSLRKLEQREDPFGITLISSIIIMIAGEIIEGEVHKILKHGVFLRCGPVEHIYLPYLKMQGYSFVPGENPIFMSENSENIEKGLKLRVMVIGVRYMEAENEFRAVATLDGDSLGPI
ncbi:RNA polymerase Rpb7-like, N-terminal domain [Heracleum sosnowskyi]|uniref:RNA polymerase Rpb7-like, N-terminal domain n=1 Tax=Heracleum sosnowskyi TaxID=360622 RepID=A0AAD8I7E7_9APIA|nr:RNA polymerase Rpb7-like, N-terminal domain [Heracleum sosnowskyi]